MTTMRVIQVPEAGADFEPTTREVPEPGRGQVRVRIQACGVCGSDFFAKEGGFPGMNWPLIPGHEIAGVVDALGEDVRPWQVGQRVGVGWYGGSCGWCEPCRKGDLIGCENSPVPGIWMDGGYAEYIVVPQSALAAIPDALSPEEAAPLMCAGVTTFNALRRSNARPGDRVAILGLGGLGHLAVQYAVKMGFETVAIGRGPAKADLAKQLGAHEYIDSAAGNPGDALGAMGGATAILSTVASADADDSVMGGLARHGRLVLIGAATGPMHVVPATMLTPLNSIAGTAAGTAKDSEDTIAFSVLTGVRAIIEPRPLADAPAAYDRMLTGKARFRMVLQIPE